MIDQVKPTDLKVVRGPNAREWLRPFFEATFAPKKLASDGGQLRRLYVKAINRFEKCIDRQARLGDLNESNLKRFGEWLAAESYGQRARVACPKLLRSVWQFAATIRRVRKSPADQRKTFAAEWAKAAKHRGRAVTLRQLATARNAIVKYRRAVNDFHRLALS